MTLDSDAYRAIAEAYPDAFITDGAATIPFLPGTAVIFDIMAGLEPSSDALGLLTVKKRAEEEQRLGRPLEDGELTRAPQLWRDYLSDKTRGVRMHLADPAVPIVAIAADIGVHEAKHLEHAERYGKQRKRKRADEAHASASASAAEAPAVDAAAPSQPDAATQASQTSQEAQANEAGVDSAEGNVADADADADADAEKKPESASDEEAVAQLAAERIPQNWKYYRGNALFRAGLLAKLIATLTCVPPPINKSLVVVGDPRRPAKRRHVPVIYRLEKGEFKSYDLDYPSFMLVYSEADFSVVHLATAFTSQNLNVVVCAVDGDTLFSLLMDTPRRAAASLAAAPPGSGARPRTCHMLRHIAGTTTLIDVNALHAEIARPGGIDALAGPSTRPRHHVEYVVTMCMLLGNDYALKFMPGVGFKTLQKAMHAHADDLAHLVTGTTSCALAADPQAPHVIRVNRRCLHTLVSRIYAGTKAAARKPPSERVDAAHAVLEWTLNYFANAANPWVADESPFARGEDGLSLHGFELIDPALPASRTNVRYAARVSVRAL